jgi:hypothetical protein
MKLTLDESVQGRRLGELKLSASNGSLKTLPTPCCLLYTSTCSVPHLTPDMVSSLSLSLPHLPLCIATESLIPLLTPMTINKQKDHRVKKQSLSSDPSLSFKSTFNGGLNEYIVQAPEAIVMTELRDLKGWLCDGTQEPGNADGVLTTTLSGYVRSSFHVALMLLY